jgi:ABC-type transporter Mla subunit MlaD
MSEEAYFSELETISQNADDELAAWADRTRDALANVTSAEEATEVLRPLLEDAGEILQTALDEVEDLSPPDEVADEHTAFTDSIRALLHEYQRLLDDYDTLGFEGVVAAIQGQDLQSLQRASDEACADLQSAAEDSGVDVDLNCGV